MPHINSRGGDDLASTDEVKVYNDEGPEEIEQRSSDKFLSEDKLVLVTETEQDKSVLSSRSFQVSGKNSVIVEDKSIGPSLASDHSFNHFGYFYHPYANGAGGLAAGKMAPVGFQPHPGLMSGPYGDIIAQPPPAHSGIQVLPVPAVHIDLKTGLPRSSMFPMHAPPGQYPMYPEFAASVQGWPGSAGGGYQVAPVGGFHSSPYIRYMAAAAAAAAAGGLLSPHPSLSPHSPGSGMSQPAMVTPGPKQDVPLSPATSHHLYDSGRFSQHSLNESQPGSRSLHSEDGGSQSEHASSTTSDKKQRVHIKKPLNAFMLFMKEMRAKVVSECTLKESAAINQILGRKWHALDRAEQAKYYEMAKKERELHMKLYPGWSARDNYAMHSKKKKKHQQPKDSSCLASSGNGVSADCSSDGKECSHPKKCRARFGLDQQSQWCKPCRSAHERQQSGSSATPLAKAPDFCRRKKRCIQYMSGDTNGGSKYSDYSEDDMSCQDQDEGGPANDSPTNGGLSSNSDVNDDLADQDDMNERDALHARANAPGVLRGIAHYGGGSSGSSHLLGPMPATASSYVATTNLEKGNL